MKKLIFAIICAVILIYALSCFGGSRIYDDVAESHLNTAYSHASNDPLIPAQATHSGKFLTTDGSVLSWGAVVSPTWGSISGTLSNQTDLWNALGGKSDTGHNHSGTYEPANANIQNHISSTSNPHSVTASQVGLGSVENTALSTWVGSANITTVGTLSSGSIPWSLLSSVPSTFTPAAHQLDSATYHTVSGLTTGHFLKATGATTFGFGAHGLTAGDVGAYPSSKQDDGTILGQLNYWNGSKWTFSSASGPLWDETNKKLVFNIGSATHPPVAFGDGDSGIAEQADDNLAVTISGAYRFYINTGYIYSPVSGGASITYATASSTVPAHSFNGDADTGVGRAGANQLSLIAGGLEAVRIDAAAVALYGQVAQTISVNRHTTADTAGNNLTVQAGGATSGATNKNGGTAIISGGTATGTGSSKIEFQTAAAGATGTVDRTPATRAYLEDDGNLYFSGSGSGLPYGSCYGDEIGWTQTSAAQNTWYAISDTDISDGDGGLNLMTHDGSGKITVTKAGRYLVTWDVSAEVSVAGKHVQVGIGVTPNGGSMAAKNGGINHFDLNLALSEIPVGGNAIYSLAASDAVEIIIRTTDAGTPNLSIDHYNLSITMIGG